jgi:plastocyanin
MPITIFGVALGIAVVACVPKQDLSTAPTEPNEIVYTDGESFLPTFVTIPVGGTVRFDIMRAPDGSGHDVTFTPGEAGAPPNIPVTDSAKIDRTFLTKGVYHYDCKVHPGMFGQITVQ